LPSVYNAAAAAAHRLPAMTVDALEDAFAEEEKEGDEDRLVDPSAKVNVDAMNEEYMGRSKEVWDELERSRWLHELDKEEGFVPKFDHDS